MGKPGTRNRLASPARGQRYKARKHARLNGKLPKSRAHEPAPWYTFTTRRQPPGFQHLQGVALVEAQLSEFGTRERMRAQAAALELPEERIDVRKPLRVKPFNRSFDRAFGEVLATLGA